MLCCTRRLLCALVPGLALAGFLKEMIHGRSLVRFLVLTLGEC